MKDYYVIWTYIGNYSNLRKVRAVSAEAAREQVVGLFSPDFQKRGNVYVFDCEPVLGTVVS